MKAEDPNLHGYRVIQTHELDPKAQRIQAYCQLGDAITRWIVTVTVVICVAAVSAAYVAQYLDGRPASTGATEGTK